MIDRCCWVKEANRKEMHFIPACMGGAANGPEGCTCQTLDERIKHLEERNRHIESEVGEMMRYMETVIEFIRKEFDQPLDFLSVEMAKQKMYERWANNAIVIGKTRRNGND